MRKGFGRSMPDSPPAAKGRAVFLSYAREDSEAAKRIADALRAFGVETWFDQGELRGGDAWDVKIRGQIRECGLFMPIISRNTQARHEGYFRREWKLGVERTHDMASGVAFILPVAIDDTPESAALVPEEFMRFQWTRIEHGIPTPEFVTRVKELMASGPRPVAKGPPPPGPVAAGQATQARASAGFAKWALGIGAAAAVLEGAYLLRQNPAAPAPAKAATAEPTPPAGRKVIAVLPFANFSSDKDNELFADGIQDEVITALAKVHDLSVISRTSVTAYRDPQGRNLRKIAAELGVSYVLEGSVQKAGDRIHLNVQLIDAHTDEHLWADSYTQDITDVFSMESALASEVASALKANFTTAERSIIARKPTENAAAYSLYLRARIAEEELVQRTGRETWQGAVDLYSQAEALDPAFLLPHVRISILCDTMYWFGTLDPSPARKEMALRELDEARKISPDAPEVHVAQGFYEYCCNNDWDKALAEYRIAEGQLPNDADLTYRIGVALRRIGRLSEAMEHMARANVLNPADYFVGVTNAETLFALRRYDKALEVEQHLKDLQPGNRPLLFYRITSKFAMDGDVESFRSSAAEFDAGRTESDAMTRRITVAFNLGDFKALGDLLYRPDALVVRSPDGTINDPVSLDRARLEFLRGNLDGAAKNAREALEFFKGQSLPERQQPWLLFGTARAEAYLGRLDEGVRDAASALDDILKRDAFSSLIMRVEYAKMLAEVGRRPDAFRLLREALAGPTPLTSPAQLRIDPAFAKFRSDPEFEEIISSAKPL
jgi:TolB-like protein